ncbi:MAG: RNA-binding domain-containing protein [Nanoarchaeota archaeon]
MKESEILELKKSTSELKEAVISIVAILNKHKTGEVYFGIKDNGDITGQDVSDATLREISKTISDYIEPKIFPKIENVLIKDRQCIYVKFEGKEVPYYAYGRAYIRTGTENKQISAKELENMILHKNKENMRWDNQINEETTLKDINEKRVKEFVKRVGQKFTSVKNVLYTLEVMKGDNILNAGVIFFDENPRKKLFNFRLRCAVFAGTSTATILDRQEFDGDILQLIEDGIQYVKKNTHTGMKIDGLVRIDIPEINSEALRETITNAYCHRDYYDSESVEIAIFQDRVEIRNPGGIYGGLTIKQLLKGEAGKRRNPLIAELLNRAHFGEKWGRGILFILEKEKDTKFKDIAEVFTVTFKRKELKIGEKAGEKINLNNRQKKAIEHIKEKGKITTKEYLILNFGIKERTARYDLNDLVERNILIKVGSTASAHYELKSSAKFGKVRQNGGKEMKNVI